MKFFAILKDSLREAIDAKVFYVMVGLSTLLILVGATATFSPLPGGQNLMNYAALPLSIDLDDLDLSALDGRGGDPHGMSPDMFKRIRGNFKVREVSPVDGAPDLPSSKFRVVVTQGVSFGQGSSDEEGERQIQERFGKIDNKRIAEVVSVERKNNEFILLVRVTNAGRLAWPHDFRLFFGALPVIRTGAPLGMQLYGLENILVNQIGSWVAILVSVVITAFFIPNMLRKGTVDMLVVKPIHRVTLLLYKYMGGLLFIFINTSIAVGGVWLALSARTGIWAPGFLISIPVITFFFAILYSVSTLLGVLTRSPIVAILMTCLVWFFLFLVGLVISVSGMADKMEDIEIKQRATRTAATTAALMATPQGMGPLTTVVTLQTRQEQYFPIEKKPDSVFYRVVSAIHFILPRTSDLNSLMGEALESDLTVMPKAFTQLALTTRKISWGESIAVSLGFIVVMLGLSCLYFARKDY
jgi:ABC-type transport system involved in multi-copper enzyme maturation permease subunit